MLIVRVKSRLCVNLPRSILRNNVRKYSVPAVNENDKPEAPAYPPILDVSYEARQRRLREDLAMEIQQLTTVEDKMLKINMPRYYGWRSLMLREGIVPYNSTEQMQYYTRTHVVDEPGLPSYYNDVITPEKLQDTVEKLKEPIENGLVLEYSSRNRTKELNQYVLDHPDKLENIVSDAVCKQVHRSLITQMGMEKPYLLETEIDYKPRIEAFWFVGGIPPPKVIQVRRRKNYIPSDMINEPVDRPVQYLGTPNFQLRHPLPLPQIIPMSESENPDFTVPTYKYETRSTGLALQKRHGTNIPGFWPGDVSQFGVVSYHSCGYLAARNERFNDTPDYLKVQAVLGSWGWLLSQACNLGFSVFNDVTYPLTNQMIITNGKWWTFCVYQLNTTIVHSSHIDENPRRNICWMTEPMQLFEKIEGDKVHGLNNQVLENLVKFYANEPQKRLGVNLRPYLRYPKYAANIKGPMRRAWLEDTFKHVVSNRPRHRRLPEVFNWQEIYLRRHQTRPLDRKRDPWEFGIDIWHRRLDDHQPRYIPKCLRQKSNPHRKWEFTYYP